MAEAVIGTGGIGTPVLNIGFTIAADKVQAAGNYPLAGAPKPVAFAVSGPIVSQTIVGAQGVVASEVTWKKITPRAGGGWNIQSVPAVLTLAVEEATPDLVSAQVQTQAGEVVFDMPQAPLQYGGISFTG